MLKAISFIGTSDYQETAYSFSETEITTCYFPYAVNTFYIPDEHYILMTEKASALHYDKISRLFKFNKVEIPDGKNEDQFWEIFDDILQFIDNEDEVILDFTYGLRSQPILSIAALIFLKSLKNIKIKKVIYGALEAKENNIVPVFDLTSFIELIDWSYAVNDFLKYGNANLLCTIMKDIQKNTYINKHPEKATQLVNKAGLLKEITNALSVVNIKKAFQQANLFPENIEGLIQDLEKIKQTKPLSLLFKHITEKISPISEAENIIFNKKGLTAQLEIIKWYIETNQYQQAITLLNEFFITLKCIEDAKEPDSIVCRTEISNELAKLIQRIKNKDEFENKDQAILWNKLSETRNNINHAGMKKDNPNPKSQIKSINELFGEVRNYFDKNLVKY